MIPVYYRPLAGHTEVRGKMKHTQVPESEQSKELFAYFGLAVYYGQALEQQLTNLLLLTKLSQGKAPTEADLTDLYQRKLSNSLGQLIKEIQHHFPFSEKKCGNNVIISFTIISKNGYKKRSPLLEGQK